MAYLGFPAPGDKDSFGAPSQPVPGSGVRRTFPRGRPKFRHNRVTSQINFRGSAEGTTILGASGGMSSFPSWI